MRRGLRWLILLTGTLETVIFTGNIFGWAALNYMLKRQGVYRHLCSPSNFTSATNITQVWSERGCPEQDKMLNLAFTVGSFCTGFTAFIWGFLLDIWGLRTVRLLINGLITSGTIMLSVTNGETSYLIFPGLTLMCLAGVPLRIANMQIANLFPKQRSTVISFYSGGFSASASIFAFLKYLLDAGVSWEWTWFVLVACSALMLPVTLFLLPSGQISDENKSKMFSGVAEVAVVSPVTFGKFSTLSNSPDFPRKSRDADCYVPSPMVPYPPSPSGKGRIPLKTTLLSFSFMAHQYWFSWMLLYTVIYIGTLHLWIERVTPDSESASSYTEIYGLVQITGLLLAPLSGVVMDFFINRAAKEDDPLERKLKTTRAAFFPMLLTTLTEAAIHLCRFYFLETAIYASIALITLLRSSFVGVGTAYLRTRFPPDHFNRLLGIMSTVAAFYTLLQFPFFVWEARSRMDSIYVNGVYCALLGLALVHPLLMTVTPLQRRLVAKESTPEQEGEVDRVRV